MTEGRGTLREAAGGARSFATCWLVGERSLLVQCAEVLVSRGYRVAGVSSPNPELRRWAGERGIPARLTARAEELRPALEGTHLDYLFSVSNEELLSAESLALAERGAVNFHDGPLPRYAGVHSTTWAILQGEKVHGVSWHRMSAGVDDGPILARRTLAVDPAETALTLNLKAFQAGLESFPEVLDALERGGAGTPQELGQRTLYRRFQRPPGAMVIDWGRPAQEIDSLCRALDFGPHPNPFGTAKLVAPRDASRRPELLIVPALEVLDSVSGLPPGTLVDVSPGGATVATGRGDVRIPFVLTMEGTRVGPDELAKSWRKGMRLDSPGAEQVELLSKVCSRAVRQEAFFVERLGRLSPAAPQEQAARPTGGAGIGSFAAGPGTGAASLVREGRAGVAAFAAFWSRWATREPFRLAVRHLHEDRQDDLSRAGLSSLLAEYLPLAVEPPGEEPVGEVIARLADDLRSLEERGPFSRDVTFRYPALRDVDLNGPVRCEIVPDPARSVLPRGAALLLAVAEDGSSMRFVHDRALLSDGDAERMARRFTLFLEAAAARPGTALSEVSLVGEVERHLVVEEWNDTRTLFPPGRTLLDLFLEQVRGRPAAMAVAFEGRSLSYGELNRQAARLAERLVALGVEPGSLVGVFLDRGIELVVALLGILKAGGAYVPLDPAYPAERIGMILDDTLAPLVVTDRSLRSRLPEGAHRPVLLDGEGREEPAASREWFGGLLFTHRRARPENPAYVIATSGSTGRPKMVPVRHESVTNLLLGVARKTGFSRSDGLLAISSVCFDLSVFDFFLPLVTGGWLEVLPTAVTHDGVLLREKVESGRMTYLQATPGTWRLLLAGGWTRRLPITIVTAGEALSRELADQVLARVDRLFSGYGPTETTVLSSLEEVLPGSHITLGLPLPNYRHYVLDDRLNPVGVGEPGEICIGGVGVSPGYLNRPGETAARFLPDPFVPGEPLYRSGDLGRFLPSGRVEFLGRGDLQVKLRGYRIELGEVESALLRDGGVRDAAVALRREADGQERLVAFIVPGDGGGGAVDGRAILMDLRGRLPEYMVPAETVLVAKLPFTPNNKVDRKLLSTWEVSRIEAVHGRPAAPGAEGEVGRAAVAGQAEGAGEGTTLLPRLASLAAETLGRSGSLDGRAHLVDLGFDSIRLAAFAAGIERSLSLRVPVASLYQHPTLEQLAAHLSAALPAGEPVREGHVGNEPVAAIGTAGRFPGPLEPLAGSPETEEAFPLSAMQRFFWDVERLAPGAYSSCCPAAFRLPVDVDLRVLAMALEGVVARHPVLRTGLREEGGEPVQFVRRAAGVPLEVRDVAGLSGDQVVDLVREEGHRSFDLTRDSLLRAALFPGERPLLLLVLHHVVTDALTLEALLADLTELYARIRQGLPLPAPPAGPSYRDFVSWQSRLLGGPEGERLRASWRALLPRGLPPLPLALDHRRPEVPRHRGETVWIEADETLFARAAAVAAAEGITRVAAWLAPLHLLLHRHTEEASVAVALPVSGRPAGFEGATGLFMNVVPVVVDLSGDPTARGLRRRVHDALTAALDQAALPLPAILDEARASAGSLPRPPLPVAFYDLGWRDPVHGFAGEGRLLLERVPEVLQEGERDLTLELTRDRGRVRLNFKYDPELFDEATVRGMAGQYLRLVEASFETPDVLAAALPLLGEEERRRVVVTWNDTARDFPLDRRVHDLFAERAREREGALAVVARQESLTYGELARRSARLARRLAAEGIGPSSLVGVLLDRSASLPAALLGVLQTGAAYVPLDPAFPRERLEFMVRDSGLAAIVTSATFASSTASATSAASLASGGFGWLPALASDLGVKIVEVDDGAGADAGELPGRPAGASSPVPGHGLAYVIYTSGSTGRPKGTRVSHRSLTNLLLSMAERPGFSGADRLLAVTTISFDIAALELFLPLVTGGVVEIAPAEETRDGARLRRSLEAGGATVLQATPATFRMLLAAGWKRTRPLKLLCGGERLSPELADRLLGVGDELWNVYGPTETTIWSTAGRVVAGERVDVGRPIANTAVYVLDPAGLPVAPGVAGEVAIGGEGVAEGYHQRPDLTGAAFVPDPFGTPFGNGRLYLTGDRGRFLFDGRIELLGRRDSQVKLRGVRIELGEVENALARVEGIRDAAVVLRPDATGQDQLFAFVVPAEPGSDPAAACARALAAWLPAAMLPSTYVPLAGLPLTPNRKADRRALSTESLDELRSRCGGTLSGEALRPSSQTANEPGEPVRWEAAAVEQTLARIVGRLVHVLPERIDPLRPLGEYGVDSVRFTALAAELSRRFDTPVEATLFYEQTTLRRVASHLLSRQAKSLETADARALSGGRHGGGGRPEPVAIVGIGGIFPGAATLDELWEHLWNGTDLISVIPPERWQAEAIQGSEGEEGKSVSRWGGFVPDVDAFDAAFFGISPREAERMDPQQRLLLRAAWRAFEHSGHAPSSFAGTRTGVFVGASGFDFEETVFRRGAPVTPHTLSGLSHAVLANRISYLFDLCGPSATVDTACSSSLVALHRAVVSVQRGECRAALAGGVNVILSPLSYVALSQGRMLSPEGRCRAFDRGANGYVRGEGAALLLLRPLSEAIADGDTIHAVILGTAENHGGRTHSLTSPNPRAQAELIVEAQSAAGVDPRTVTYVEAHGTGTALGDPIEVNGLKAAFTTLHERRGLPPPSRPTCGIGSLKTNLGHLEAAAGVAGVVKVALAMRHGKLPGLLHNEEVNPLVDLGESPFYLVRENQEWGRLEGSDGAPVPRRAGVSSFGFGGANAHVVLEEHLEEARTAGTGAALVPLSAADRPRLVAQCRELAAFLEGEAGRGVLLHDLAFTLQAGREAMAERVAIVAASVAELREKLLAVAAGGSHRLPSIPGTSNAAGASDLSDLARRWEGGEAVDWKPLHPLHTGRRRRIPLPGHPFEDVRYGAGAAEAPRRVAAGRLVLRPLAGEREPAGASRPEPPSTPPAPLVPPAAPPAARGTGEPRGESRAGLAARLKEELASVLYADAAKLDADRPFVDLGLDSILTVEFARQVERMTGRSFRATDLYDHPTLARLTTHLLEAGAQTLPFPAAPEAAAAPELAVAPSGPSAPLPALSPAQLQEMLAETLAAVLYVEPSRLAPTRAFVDLGVDSILGVEFVRELSRLLRLDLAASTLYDHSTLEALARHLHGLLPDREVADVSRVEASSGPGGEGGPSPGAAPSRDIAIIGCSGRFPGAADVREFWANLAAGVCSVTEVPPERWDSTRLFDEDPGRPGTSTSRWGGFLADVDRFDPLFFSISPSDAELMDPQQRLFLEETWRSLEDAGYSADGLAGSSTGVWVGVTGSDRYRDRLDGSRPAQEMLGNAHSILAGRVSYALDLRGPAIAVDTACSSSLVAIHLACQSLLAGETDLALAGGVTLYLGEDAYVEMTKAGMLAPDGRCKAFDDRADGFVPGEAVGVVVLKRLSEALADSDHVYGVIRGSGVNQDGRSNGLTAPSARSQAELETRVYRRAGVDPGTITLVEAHGTGTKLGDPIEVEALTKSFRERTDRRQFCALGSVKTNIGHTTAAAGVASVIKVLMALRHRKIPPSLHFERENRHLRLADSPFFVSTRLAEWASEPGVPRRAAVSSFGFSGTNAHLVLEEAPQLPPAPASEGPQLFLLSAKTRGSLERRVSDLLGWLSKEGASARMGDVAFTLASRVHFPLRVGLVAESLEELRRELSRLSAPAALDALRTANPPGPGMEEEGERIVSEIVSTRLSGERLREKLVALARLYTAGVVLRLDPWLGGRGRRLPLPTYPFERERCWAAAPQGAVARFAAGAEPPETRRRGEEFVLHRTFRRSDPVVRDHEVEGRLVVPGMVLLGAAVEARTEARRQGLLPGERPGETGVLRVVRVAWLRPVVVEGTETAVRVRLVLDGADAVRFRVESGEATLHAEGALEPVPAGVPPVDLHAAEARMGELLTGEALYALMESSGVRYGPALRGLTRVLFGRDEALATLREEESLPADPFPAALLDAALQATAVLTRGEDGRVRTMLPFGLDELTVHRPVPAGARALVARKGEGRFDAVVTGLEGEVCATVTGLVLREPRGASDGRGAKGSLLELVTAAPLPSRDPDEWSRLQSGRARLEEIARRAALEALLSLGVLRPGSAVPEEGWRHRLGLLPAYVPLVETLLGLAGKVPRGEQTPTAGPAAGSDRLAERHPELGGRLALLSRCADALPDVVTGKRSALEVLFPSGSPELVESVYQGDGLADLANRCVASVVKRFAEERLAVDPRARLDILEVGAGTGATTRAVLDALLPLGTRVRYVFSDVSAAFVRRAAEFLSAYPSVERVKLDLERDPAGQGFPRGSFDVVIGTNVVHATARVGRTLGFLRELLRTGGLAVVSEATVLDDFAVVTFGLTPGWWAFEDAENRIPGSPLVARERWRELFAGLFSRVHDLAAGHPLLARGGQSVLVAEAGPVDSAPGHEGPGAPRRDAVAYVKGLLARVLKIDQARLSEDASFDVYGLDSLGVLDVNRELEKDFGRLPSTLLFEHLTIGALATYFAREHAAALSRMRGPAVPAAPEPAPRPAPQPFALPSPARPREGEGGDIAILGVAGRYPLGATIDEVWESLEAGRSGIRLVPAERWDWRAEGEGAPRWGGFLQGVDRFDSLYFGISPREAAAMDPQERLFLETAAAVLEDAGFTRRHLSALGSEVGVFVGVMAGDYEWLAAEAAARGLVTDAHAAHWPIANRVSYFFDLKGPSLAVDTACSSSLTAIHLACESLRRGECRAAIAGGVNLILHPVHFRRLARAGMLSPGERCRSFGAGADGFVDGEGVGAVLLKPLARALADGDPIRGVIRGSAINAGGKTSGFTVPSPVAQGDLVTAALRSAGVDPRTVTYVEAHGTGTSLGDPVEIAGLTRAFGGGAPGRSWCAIGSAKSNAGHLEAAAGVLGLTKVLLQMWHGKLVPSLHAEELNPKIDFEASPFRVQRELSAWERPRAASPDSLGPLAAPPRRAGVSSFGAGGANAHLVVEEFEPPWRGEREDEGEPELIVLSARDRERLDARVAALASFLSRRLGEGRLADEGLTLGNVAFTLQDGREAMAERLAFVARSVGEAVGLLVEMAAGREPEGVLRGGVRGTPFLSGDDDVRELLDRWVAKGKLSKVGEAWVSGAEVDFGKLARRGPRRKVSLPTYPFAPVRHWIGGGAAEGQPVRWEERPPGRRGAAADRLLYVPRWERRSLRPAPAGEPGGVTVVLLPPEKGAEELAARLARAHAGARTVTLRLGSVARVEDGVREVPAADPHALVAALVGALEGDLHGVSRVYHLGALQRAGGALDDLASLGRVQEAGLLSLFRLVKALREGGARSAEILVATGGVHRLFSSEPPSTPFAGTLPGFVRSLSREYGGWRVRCVDLDGRWPSQEAGALAAALRAELAETDAGDVALREGCRFVRTLLPLDVERPVPFTFPERGVVLIVGGGGGLGLELAAHLAAARSRLVLVGRRSLDAAQRARIAEIERLGGEVAYFQADASVPASLEAAVAQGRERFGPIQAAVHSALVLADRTVDRMDEATLQAALSPKVEGCVALLHALRAEPLEFLLFFSSAESFSGDPGQSNYSAASTFEDAFAAAVGAAVTYPVKTVNWGYWGEVGVVATEQYRARLAALGVHSLSTADGMATVDWLLGEPRVRQVLAIRADDGPLARMGADLSRRVVAHALAADASSSSSASSARPRLAPVGRRERDDEASLRFRNALGEMERLGRELLVATLRRMGVPLGAGARLDPVELFRSLGIAPGRRKLFAALFAMLERAGWLREREGLFNGSPGLEEVGRDAEGAAARLAEFGRKVPEVAPQCELLGSCLAAFPGILTGGTQPTDVLFPGGSLERVAGIYRGHAVADAANRLAAQRVRELCEARSLAAGGKGPIRVLEVGAGTGGTSVFVLRELASVPRVEYVYTDVSRAFLAHGRSAFGGEFPFVEFRLLDVEREGAEQGFEAARFDVVVASNVLHATRDLGRTLGRVKGLLAPGGWLVLNEAFEAEDFLTLTFGLLDGWWLGEDVENRIASSPLASAAQWRRLLEEEGFEPLVTEGEAPGEGGVLLARSDGLVRLAGRDRPPEPLAESPVAAMAVPGAAASGEPSTRVRDAVVSSVAKVLELGAGQIDDTTPFTDLGIDSLLAAEVARSIGESLGAELKPTDLYDHPTVGQLVRYVVARPGLPPGAEPARKPVGQKTTGGEAAGDAEAAGVAGDEWIRSLLRHVSEGEVSVSEAERILERG